MSELGKKVLALRTAKRITQESLAESANISLRTLQRIEKEGSNPQGDTLHRLAKALNIRKPSAWYIFHRIAGSGIFGGKELNGPSSKRGAPAGHVLTYQEARGKQYQCPGLLPPA